VVLQTIMLLGFLNANKNKKPMNQEIDSNFVLAESNSNLAFAY